MIRQGRVVRLDGELLAEHRAGALLALSAGVSATLRETARGLPYRLHEGGVAEIEVFGPLSQRGWGAMCGWIDGYDVLTEVFTEAAEDEDVSAIVLRIDSPGGDVAGIEEAIRRMRASAEGADKPVLAAIDERAGSAACWIAADVARDGVYGPAAAEIGSIGVIAVHVHHKDERREVTIIREPAGKAVPNSLEALGDLGLERIRSRVQEVEARFVAAVAAARGMSPEAIRKLNADMLPMRAAAAAGLANGVESFEETIARAAALGRRRQEMRKQMKGLTALLGLAAGAPDEQVEAALEAELPALQRRARVGAEVEKLAGTSTEQETLGAIHAWKAAAGALPEAQARVAELEAEQAKSKAAEEAAERRSLYEKVGRALGPAAAWKNPEIGASSPNSLEPLDDLAAMPLGALRAMAKRLPDQPPPAPPTPPSPPAAASAMAMLNPTERAYCEETGTDPATFLAAKREMFNRGASAPGQEV